MEQAKGAFHIAAIRPDIKSYAERGYLNILDTNNTYFDYDMELDDLWLDLDFPRRPPLRRLPRQRRR